MKKKVSLTLVGQSLDGLEVVSGVYRFFETHGIPLDVLFDTFRQRNLVPHWASFYEEASAAGMSHDRILVKLDEAISDSYGKEVRDSVLKGLSLKFGSDGTH